MPENKDSIKKTENPLDDYLAELEKYEEGIESKKTSKDLKYDE